MRRQGDSVGRTLHRKAWRPGLREVTLPVPHRPSARIVRAGMTDEISKLTQEGEL